MSSSKTELHASVLRGGGRGGLRPGFTNAKALAANIPNS
jgi:hypothetical protein